jgi:hypothetical protein
MVQKLICGILILSISTLLIFNRLSSKEGCGIFLNNQQSNEVIYLKERNGHDSLFGYHGFQSHTCTSNLNVYRCLTLFIQSRSISAKVVSSTPKPNSFLQQYDNLNEYLWISPVDSYSGYSKKPPLKSEKIGLEFLVGGASGLVGSIVGAFSGGLLTLGFNNEVTIDEIGEIIVGALIGGTVGLTAGSSLGVYLIGKRGNETGSYWTTLLSSTGGLAAWLAITAIFLHYDYEIPSGLWWTGLYVLPTAGGVIGFNLTRRYKTSLTSNTALLNFRGGQIRFAVPTIYFCLNPLAQGDLIKNIDLVEARF